MSFALSEALAPMMSEVAVSVGEEVSLKVYFQLNGLMVERVLLFQPQGLVSTFIDILIL